MTRGVLDRDRPALSHRQQREPLETGIVRDCLQIGDPGPQAVIGDASIRQAVTALVISDHGRDPTQLDQKVPPHRTLPIELQMAQPTGVDQQRRTRTVHRVRDPHTVGRAGKSDVLHRVRSPGHHQTIVDRRSITPTADFSIPHAC